MKKMIIEMVLGHEYLYFEDALRVKKTPHTPTVNIWAISVSPKDEIFLMDNNQDWHRLDETDMEYNLIIASLWARLKVISKNYSIAS